ncbi:MAG: hypothetical protein ACTSRB_15955 [Candidatus Helarchaeota archaeon]
MTKEEYYARIIWLKAIISIVLFVLGAANIAIALTFQKMNIRIGFLFIQYDIVTASCFSIFLFIIAFILLITGPSFERKTRFSSVYEYRQYKKKQKFKVSCSFKNEIDSMISDLILQVLKMHDEYHSIAGDVFPEFRKEFDCINVSMPIGHITEKYLISYTGSFTYRMSDYRAFSSTMIP